MEKETLLLPFSWETRDHVTSDREIEYIRNSTQINHRGLGWNGLCSLLFSYGASPLLAGETCIPELTVGIIFLQLSFPVVLG